MEKILVLMSSYNGEKYIRQQIDSILNQKGCIAHLLVRDDGSIDSTCEIVKSYEIYGRVKLLNEKKNLHAARSFLRLIELASEYDYYAFADQDDVWDEDKLIIGITILKNEKGPAIYCSNARVVDENLNMFGYNVYRHSKHTNLESVIINGNFMGCTMIFNNKLREKILSFLNPSYCLMHDYYLSVLCMLMGGKIIYDEIPHMSYRIHGKNTVGVSTNFLEKIKKQLKFILKKGEFKRVKQCESILKVIEFGDIESREFVEIVSKCKSNKSARVLLLKNTAIKYETIKDHLNVIIHILKGTL